MPTYRSVTFKDQASGAQTAEGAAESVAVYITEVSMLDGHYRHMRSTDCMGTSGLLVSLLQQNIIDIFGRAVFSWLNGYGIIACPSVMRMSWKWV